MFHVKHFVNPLRNLAEMPLAKKPACLRWTAFECADRLEQTTAASIAAGGHEIYNPIQVHKFVRRGIVRKVIHPFFPGYVFARIDIHDWHALSVLLEFKGVIDVVRAGQCVGLIRDSDILRVRQLENEHGEIPDAVAKKFKLGDFVRVADGPFSSFSGSVSKLGEEWSEREISYGIKRIDLVQFAFVDVRMFGRITPVKLFADQIEHA
jgi:transcriptional antiterminator NusG